MFIVSKRNYKVRRADGSSYLIEKDFIGDIPNDVAQSSLVQRAIKAGMVFSPQGTKDKQIEHADDDAKKKAAKNDKRLDSKAKEEQPAIEDQ